MSSFRKSWFITDSGHKHVLPTPQFMTHCKSNCYYDSILLNDNTVYQFGHKGHRLLSREAGTDDTPTYKPFVTKYLGNHHRYHLQGLNEQLLSPDQFEDDEWIEATKIASDRLIIVTLKEDRLGNASVLRVRSINQETGQIIEDRHYSEPETNYEFLGIDDVQGRLFLFDALGCKSHPSNQWLIRVFEWIDSQGLQLQGQASVHNMLVRSSSLLDINDQNTLSLLVQGESSDKKGVCCIAIDTFKQCFVRLRVTLPYLRS